MSNPFILRVTFSGLSAFAHKKDGKELSVFMPDASKANEEVIRPGLEPHHAYLSANYRNLKISNVKSADGRFLWRLNGIDLRIKSADGTPPPLDIEGFGKPEPVLTAKPADGGFWWLAPLEKACLNRKFPAGGGTLDGRLLKEPMDDKFGLAVRIKHANGKISVKSHLKMRGAHVVWRFRSANGKEKNSDHRQILAADIQLEQEIKADYVTFEASPLTSSTPTESVDLYPIQDDQGVWRVDVVIRNEEPSQFFPNPNRRDPQMKRPHKRDRLFERFYDLAMVPPAQGDAPLPVADYLIGTPDGGGAQTAPPCSPSKLEPY